MKKTELSRDAVIVRTSVIGMEETSLPPFESNFMVNSGKGVGESVGVGVLVGVLLCRIFSLS